MHILKFRILNCYILYSKFPNVDLFFNLDFLMQIFLNKFASKAYKYDIFVTISHKKIK